MEAKPDGCEGELKNKLNEMLNVVVVPEMSRIHEQCIYKIPPRIHQANPQAYTPQVISIGPFHSPHDSTSDNILVQMDKLKLKYLKGFLRRTNLSVNDLVLKFQKLENRIRSCYGGIFSFNSNDFLKIIIIDACFIIEHFLRFSEYNIWILDDPILLKPWLCNDIARDLILLENQIPFFVLEKIYKLARINSEYPSFLPLATRYFRPLNLQNINPVACPIPKQFTDLLRTFLLPTQPSSFHSVEKEKVEEIGHVRSASQLSEAGLVFEVSESKCLLDLNFDDKGVLKMPCFTVDDGTESYMRNILAFEECHISDVNSRYISQYLSILDFLINSEKDVSILVDKKIIVNEMGDANEVATMVNQLCKNILVPDQLNSKYKYVCHRLNRFYENPMNKYKAILVHEYFNTPWRTASTLTAVLLVLFTLIQTVCSIYSLF